MTITFKGQLQAAADCPSLEITPENGESIHTLIQRLAHSLPDEAQHLLLADDGSVRPSLFVALDNTHLHNLDTPATGNELILMPPMAGG